MLSLSPSGQQIMNQPYASRLKLALTLSQPNQDIMPYLASGSVCCNAAAFYSLLQKQTITKRDLELLNCTDKSAWNRIAASYPSEYWDGKKPIANGAIIAIRRYLPGQMGELSHVVAVLTNTFYLVKGINGSCKFSNSWTMANGLLQIAQHELVTPNSNHPQHPQHATGFKLDFDQNFVAKGYKYLFDVINLH